MKNLNELDSHAAFVDVGSEQMHVSIAGGAPKVFGAMTHALNDLRDWLLAEGAKSVAMEATGVYWLPLYGVLEAAGLKVMMVDGRQTRHLPGRKSDIQDCQWGATLHAHGLLRAGFVPNRQIRCLQSYLRLFALKQAVQSYEHYQLQIKACDGEVAEVLKKMGGDDNTPVEPKGPRKRPGSNAPKIEGLRAILIRLPYVPIIPDTLITSS